MNAAIGKNTSKVTGKKTEAKRAEAKNDSMDAKGGGPMKWSQFYGTTAEKFFYHPTDQNSTYHTETILVQKFPGTDIKTEGVPSSQGTPAHQRPPQFDYIYRANENAREKAETEAAEFKGKLEELMERRHRLEVEQAGLWCEVAFRAVSHYDLDKRPLYRFQPLLPANPEKESQQNADSIKTATSFMALALSIIDEAQKDQATTFSKIKPAISEARQKLNDSWLALGVDVADRKSPQGRFGALAKRLDDVASNLSDSYVVATEGDQAKDQQRKDTFRALLQQSLVSYAQIILALDEMSMLMKDEWKFSPEVGKPILFASLADTKAIAVKSAAESQPKTVDPQDKDDGTLAKKVTGMYHVSLVQAKGLREVFVNFRSDYSLRFNGEQLGSWEVEKGKVNMKLSKPEFAGTIKLVQGSLTGTLTDAKGLSWKMTANRLSESKWELKVGDGDWRRITLWSNGRIGNLEGTDKWAVNGNNITLTWSSGHVDRCRFSADKRRFEGKNEENITIAGKLIEE